MASLNGPFLSRTCLVGKGLTFHALLSKLNRRSSLWALSTVVERGGLPNDNLGSSTPLAAVAAVATNCLREISPPNLTGNSPRIRVQCRTRGGSWATILALIGLFCTQKPVRFEFVF
jgi:hypothetical protein